MRLRRGCGERGAATTVGVVLLGVLVLVVLLIGAVGGAVVDQRRVESAADLGALAGAAALQLGRDGCAAADAVVARNEARVVRCSREGDDLVLRAARPPRRVLGLHWTASSTARAGPTRG